MSYQLVFTDTYQPWVEHIINEEYLIGSIKITGLEHENITYR